MDGIHLVMHLPRNEIPADDIIALSHELLLFQPTGFKSMPKARQFKRLGSKTFWEQLRLNLSYDDKMHMDAHSGIYDSLFFRYEPVTDILAVFLYLKDDRYDAVHEIVQRFVQTHPVYSAALRTRAESSWNSYVNFLRANENRSVAKIKAEHPEITEVKLVYQNTTPPTPLIDNRQFAGYTTEFDGVWFGCTNEMWFGKGYDKYLPLQTLAAFTECANNETLRNGTVHITMYDTPDAFKEPGSQRRAWAFRALTDYVNLAEAWRKRLAAAPERRGFANMEIEDGSFPHGGCKRILTYLDENGRPTIRKKASQVHISERGSDGTAVFEEIAPITKNH
ncbi:MAG: hypothetical protein IK134_12455 [Oscillospiraceae bacterium]|nr:hypothetical protein [Oscillospiraceae bacterium]